MYCNPLIVRFPKKHIISELFYVICNKFNNGCVKCIVRYILVGSENKQKIYSKDKQMIITKPALQPERFLPDATPPIGKNLFVLQICCDFLTSCVI